MVKFILFILCCSCCLISEEPVVDYMLKNKENVALDGYDVVSYFQGEPVKGKEEFQMPYADVIWYFVNEENLNKFIESKSRYLPAYHGYCVYAISNGRLVKGVLQYWKVYQDKLYFLCTEEAFNAWLMSPDYYIKSADSKWEEMLYQKKSLE